MQKENSCAIIHAVDTTARADFKSALVLLQKGFAGILFRYQDSRSFYALSFHNGTLELKVKKHE